MMALGTVVFISLLTFVSLSAEHNGLNDYILDGSFEFYDLTFPFDEKTVYWPNAQRFTFTKQQVLTTPDGKWYASNDMAAGEHGGTHIDAPYHFTESGKRVGDIPLNKLIVPLIIADVSSQVNGDPNFVLYKHNLDYMLNDNFGKPCVIVFKFGWSQYFNDTRKYLGINETTNTLNFPGISAEVAEWITQHKNIVGVGVDVASVDPGSSMNFAAHNILSAVGLYNLENVKLTTFVPEYGCTALVMPMKIAQGTGAPTRLVAICPKRISNKINVH